MARFSDDGRRVRRRDEAASARAGHDSQIRRRDLLGGLVHEYELAA
jgi:hypothetical protein